MSINVNDQKYYRTAEVCRMVGVSRTTFFRWLKEGIIEEARLRDRRGWRLFTEEEVERLKEEAHRMVEVGSLKS